MYCYVVEMISVTSLPLCAVFIGYGTFIVIALTQTHTDFLLILIERHQHTLSQRNCYLKSSNVEMRCRS